MYYKKIKLCNKSKTTICAERANGGLDNCCLNIYS